MRLVSGSNDAVCQTLAPPMRQALCLSFQVSEPGSPGAGMVKVRQTSAPVLASKAPAQLRVPMEPPVLSPTSTSSLPPRVLTVSGAPEKPCTLEGVPVVGSVGAAAFTFVTNSAGSQIDEISRAT